MTDEAGGVGDSAEPKDVGRKGEVVGSEEGGVSDIR